MVFCSRCGQENQADSKFCTRCANPLSQVPPQTAPAQPWQPVPPPYVPPKKDNTTLIIVVAIIMVVIVIVSVYATWVFVNQVEDIVNEDVTITVTSYTDQTLQLELFVQGEKVDSFTLGPGGFYSQVFPFSMASWGDMSQSDVVLISYVDGSINNEYLGSIWMNQNGVFICEISIYS